MKRVGEEAISTVQGRINETIEEQRNSLLLKQIQELAIIKKSVSDDVEEEIALLKSQFEKDTKEFFKVKLDTHINAASNAVETLNKQKEALQTAFDKMNNQLSAFKYDFFDMHERLVAAVLNTGFQFYSIPDNDPDFKSFICTSTNTLHRVPKSFDRWTATGSRCGPTLLFVIYSNNDTDETIEIPAELLNLLENPDGGPLTRLVKQANAIDNEIVPVSNFDPFKCPVCGKDFEDPTHTRMHLDQIRDDQHHEYREAHPEYRELLKAAI